MSQRFRAVFAAALLLSAVGCSSQSSQQDGLGRLTALSESSSSSKSARSDAGCTGQPNKDLGSGVVCADSGFRVSDMPRFANWNGLGKYTSDEYLGPEFVATFGSDNVCASVTGDLCTLTTDALNYYEKFREFIKSGRCEGVVMIAALTSLKLISPSAFNESAENLSELQPNVGPLVRTINYWWSTQFDENVRKASEKFRKEGVKEIVQQLGATLQGRVSATLGLYSGNSGHAVLPVALLRNPSGEYVVVVYDSNSPGRFGRVMIDVEAGTWKYPSAGLNGSPRGWSGRNGAIDLTPLSARPVGASCSFCKSKKPSSVTVEINAAEIIEPKASISN